MEWRDTVLASHARGLLLFSLFSLDFLLTVQNAVDSSPVSRPIIGMSRIYLFVPQSCHLAHFAITDPTVDTHTVLRS